TRYNDIMTVDTNHDVFSSEGGITLPPSEARVQKMIEAGAEGGGPGGLFGPPPGQEGQGGGGPRMFIAMDPPRHDEQRKTVSPAVSPHNLLQMEPQIRERAGQILDALPIGEPFDWVDKVSMELTAMTLATLFDMPQVDRRRLTRWSDVVMAQPGHGIVDSWEQKRAEMFEYGSYFLNLWNERKNAEPGGDLISMLAHGEATRHEPVRIPRQRDPADDRRQRHDAEHHLRLGLRAKQVPRPVRQAARRSLAGAIDGLRDHPLADSAGPHETRRQDRLRARRQEDPRRRHRRHVVR